VAFRENEELRSYPEVFVPDLREHRVVASRVVAFREERLVGEDLDEARVRGSMSEEVVVDVRERMERDAVL